MKTIDLCRPFAAHCIGYPMVTLGFGFKTYLAYKWRLRKQREVRKMNESYIQLINQALPIEIQQEAEKEKLLREKGSFVESYDECSNPSDGTLPTTSSTSSSSSSSTSPAFSLMNSALLNSQTQVNSHPTSLPCTATKRSQKLTNNSEDFSTSNSLVQTTTTTTSTRNNNNNPTTTTTKLYNGNDEDTSSTYKQQKKQLVKSSNLSSRRQQRKQDTKESTRPTSRDSSTSYQNGSPSAENTDLDKR